MGRHELLAPLLLTAIVPIIWGSTYLVTTEFLPPGIPLIAAMLRALPAGVIILLFSRQLPKGQWWFKSILLGVLNIGAFFYFLFVAAYHLPGGIAAIVMSVQPILVLFYSTLLFKQSVTFTQIAACILACLGVAMIVLQGDVTLDVVGVTAGIAGALSMATGITLTKYWGRPKNVSLMTFTGWQLLFGGLILLPIAMVNESLPSQLTVKNITGFTYLCLIGALLAYALWFRGIEKLPALSISFISLLSPLSAALLGYFFLSQTLGALQISGGIAVVLAIVLIQPSAALSVKKSVAE